MIFGLLAAPSAFAQSCLSPDVIQCNEGGNLSVDFVNDEDTYSACGATGYAGADSVYRFSPAAGTEFFARVEDYDLGGGNDPDVDLIVVEDSCEIGACVSYTPRTANGEWEPMLESNDDGLIDDSHVADGSDYFLHIDTKAPLGGWSYGLELFCNTCDIPADVSASLTCASDLIGESSVRGTSSMNYYTCGTPYAPLQQLGQEVIYEFAPQETGDVTFTLENMTTDHDLYVLESLCLDQNCIAGNSDAGNTTTSVTFTAVAGTVYYVVVEDFEGGGSFDLSIQDNTGGCYEDCDDGIDNDIDGSIDCSDSDCSGDPVCVSAEACSNGIDDDGDGLADYPADPGCASPSATNEAPQCQDGLNNDGAFGIDFDGGESVHGACSGGVCPPGVSDPNEDGVADPDPQCTSFWDNREAASSSGGSCGLGIELALLLPLLGWRYGTKRDRAAS
jgi:hypothetical protein